MLTCRHPSTERQEFVPRRKRQKNKAKAADGSKPAEEDAGDSAVEQTNGDAGSAAEPQPQAALESGLGGEDEEMM